MTPNEDDTTEDEAPPTADEARALIVAEVRSHLAHRASADAYIGGYIDGLFAAIDYLCPLCALTPEGAPGYATCRKVEGEPDVWYHPADPEEGRAEDQPCPSAQLHALVTAAEHPED